MISTFELFHLRTPSTETIYDELAKQDVSICRTMSRTRERAGASGNDSASNAGTFAVDLSPSDALDKLRSLSSALRF